ncbi:proton-coupled zinc antiporter SLC30A2 [Amyelois transitella]|uniref:proton-coupled zinc antiporter SLC30A2 n=1 Tax=Amyelois transitella TaxID=680683 RepID=UPI00067E496C|nr:proton-coupled zinc antiporter SLC30A2 [Amyelois transitella]
MSDELEARMWDDGGSRYESRARGAFFESAFASSEHLDRAPLLSEETYTDVPVTPITENDQHCHWRPQAEPPSAIPQLLLALVLCGFFMVCELIGGYLAGSLSVMSDAAHMLSDCGGFALALLAFQCAKRKPDVNMSYGYKRAEVLGAMVSVLLIWILTGVFVYIAVVRLHTGEYNIEPDMMMIVSGCGVAFNVVLALVLHGCASDLAHHHTHGGAACAHSHARAQSPRRFKLFRRRENKQTNGTLVNGDYSMKDLSSIEANVVSKHDRNINLRAALIHVIGDLIQSCGVLLASILIKFYPAAKFVDPICTFVFSILVLLTSARVVRDALAMLMQAVPPNFRYRECVTSLSSVPGVRHVHSLHVWALSTHHKILTAHVAIDELTDHEQVLHACQQLARTEFGVQSATFQTERYSASMAACQTCLDQPAALP